MKKYRVEFSTTEYVYIKSDGLSDAYWTAKEYENDNRFILDIEFVYRVN